jgi:hypothetical protein
LLWFSGTDPDENLLRWHIRAYLPAELQVVDASPEEWPQRVWMITGDWFNAQVQADFKALEATHPVQRVVGDCTRQWCFIVQLMEAPPLDAPESFSSAEDSVPFRGLSVDRITADEIAARLWWQAPDGSEPPLRDYSIGLQLLDSNGRLVAQADGPIRHYGEETVQTSQLQPGRIYMDVRPLDLPPDLPPGDYTLAVVVYQSWDGARLTLPDGHDAWTQPITLR